MDSKKEINNKSLFSFRESDVLPILDFIAYCALRGVSVTSEELRLYEKIDLLHPVKKVNRSDYYSVYQIYPLKHIQEKLKIKLPTTVIEATAQEWLSINHKIKINYFKNVSLLKKECSKYIDDFSVYISLLAIATDVLDKAEYVYKSGMKEGIDKIENFRDLNSALKLRDRESKVVVTSILESKKFIVEDLMSLQKKYINIGADVDPIKNLYAHFQAIDFIERIRCTGSLLFAQESYAISDNIGFFIKLLGKTPLEVVTELSGESYYKICPYCGNKFTPKRDSHYTCGREECTQLGKNITKRNKYHLLKQQK